VTHHRLIVLNGATSIVAIAALIVVLSLAPRFSSIERQSREVRREIVTLTLKLPPGVHARIRKEVVPVPPVHVPLPAVRPAPA
jgi:hypothetical protein